MRASKYVTEKMHLGMVVVKLRSEITKKEGLVFERRVGLIEYYEISLASK